LGFNSIPSQSPETCTELRVGKWYVVTVHVVP
jgi:hypothetical protein